MEESLFFLSKVKSLTWINCSVHLCKFLACVISLLILSSVLSSLWCTAGMHTHTHTHSRSLAHKLAVNLITSDRMVHCPSRSRLTAHQHQLMDILSPTFISSKRQLPGGNWEILCLECLHTGHQATFWALSYRNSPKKWNPYRSIQSGSSTQLNACLRYHIMPRAH